MISHTEAKNDKRSAAQQEHLAAAEIHCFEQLYNCTRRLQLESQHFDATSSSAKWCMTVSGMLLHSSSLQCYNAFQFWYIHKF